MRFIARSSIKRRAVSTALLALGALVLLPMQPMFGAETLRRETVVLVTKDRRIEMQAEIADTAQSRALGLMFRPTLADDAGMLFLYDEVGDIQMWMRNTYIPLDMVFITAEGTVRRIEHEAEPFSEIDISSGGPVAAVLELKGGAAARLGLAPGDRIEHPRLGKPAS